MAHRDIKAENLVIDANCNVKLIDFGFAYKLENGPSNDELGSGCYLAPEIMKGLSHCPVKADIFAIGVLLYFLITGQYPWHTASA